MHVGCFDVDVAEEALLLLPLLLLALEGLVAVVGIEPDLALLGIRRVEALA